VTCVHASETGCRCGCPPTYTYCEKYFGPGTGACISPGTTCQDVTQVVN
jgi:hypothetical protein